MNKFLGYFVENRVFANILTILILLSGLISLFLMRRELFPEFSLDMITVLIPYPGADPEEVEEGICRKIEEAIDMVEGIKRYTTVASENMGMATIEVMDSYDVREVYDKVRNAVDSISTFPKDAEKPIINEVTIRREVIQVVLSGNLTDRIMKEYAEQIKDELQALPEISQVTVFGTKQYEIGIEVSEEMLRKYGITFSQVANAVRANNLNIPSGLIRTKGAEIRVRTMGRKYYADQLAKIVVLSLPTGEVITLDRIANIRDDFVEDPIIATYNGEKCVVIACFRTQEEDDIAIADAVYKYVNEKAKSLPPNVKLSVWLDRSRMIKARLSLLRDNGIQGLIIVVVLLLMLMNARLSFFVTLGIPISFAGALSILYLRGDSINMMSLFGMIMVLGMLVDDAIVIGEAIYYHRQKGNSPLKSAILGVEEVGLPVIGAVTTTIVAFLPLLFVRGIMGKFIKILPVVVISALSVSLFEALFLLPAHLNDLPDLSHTLANSDTRKHPLRRLRWFFSDSLDWLVERIYLPFVSKTVKNRYLTLAVFIFVAFAVFGMLRGQIIKFEVFSKVDGDFLSAEIEFPAGTPISVTESAVREVENALRRVAEKFKTLTGEPMIKGVFSVVGQSSGGGFNPQSGSNRAEIRVELLPSERRGIHSERITSAWSEEVGEIPGVLKQSFQSMGGGPRGTGIELWLRSEDLEELLLAKEEIKERLRSYEGVYQIEDDYRPAKIEARFRLKPEGYTLGLTLDSLGRQLASGFFGEEAVRIQRGRDDIRIRVRYPREDRSYLSILNDVRIRTPQGYEVPLLTVADVEYVPGFATITRVDGMRRVIVSADVDTNKANSTEITMDLAENFLPALQRKYPGLIWSFEGPEQTSRDALSSLKVGFPLALLGIFLIISSIFHSYSQPILIMLSIPFGIVGALIGHLIFGLTVTLMSLFGIVALAGVVVNDAIVLVDCFNNNLASGQNFYEALIQAGRRRFRPIFLTSSTTFGGLIGLLFTRDMQSQFLKPMAVSLAIGLVFATTITLVLMPSLIAILNDMKRILHLVSKKRLPAPEEVEPALALMRQKKELESS